MVISRMDFYELEEDLESAGRGFVVEEVGSNADKFITCVNSSYTNPKVLTKLDLLRRAENEARAMVQKLVSKINPDTNRLIHLEEEKRGSYSMFTTAIGILFSKIDETKEQLKNHMANRERIESNKITNKVTLDYYSSFLENIVHDLIYLPLSEALIKYTSLDDDNIVLQMVTPSSNSTEQKKDNPVAYKTKKDKEVFWYLVFSYIFRSSQIIGALSSSPIYKNTAIPNQFYVNELKRFTRATQRKYLNEQISEEVPNAGNKRNKEEQENPGHNQDNNNEETPEGSFEEPDFGEDSFENDDLGYEGESYFQ